MLEIIGLVIAVLTFFGVQPSEIAIRADLLPALLYLLAGFLIGWGICRAFYGIRFKFSMINDSRRMTIDQFAEQFDAVPYDLKAFLKTVLREGAAYRRTDDSPLWETYLDYLSNFVTMQTLQNGISKYTMKNDCQKMFEENPRLLACVSDDDIDIHAIGGTEGVLPTYMSSHFYWWYYSDASDMPKPFSAADYIFRKSALAESWSSARTSSAAL
ncbi:MAG: hypothetical protein LKH39_08825 [Atopobiaceae bacterium]|nr:hypothetical protein [Atopobiaceae bacterium]